jgi:hypothetical protein
MDIEQVIASQLKALEELIFLVNTIELDSAMDFMDKLGNIQELISEKEEE